MVLLPARLSGLLAAVLLAAGAASAEPPAARQDEILHALRHDCGSCHGLTLHGGLGPALLPASLAETPEEALVEIVLDGLPGTPMPPWRFILSQDEATWLVRRLKEGL
jgi:cytochrome c55X